VVVPPDGLLDEVEPEPMLPPAVPLELPVVEPPVPAPMEVPPPVAPVVPPMLEPVPVEAPAVVSVPVPVPPAPVVLPVPEPPAVVEPPMPEPPEVLLLVVSLGDVVVDGVVVLEEVDEDAPASSFLPQADRDRAAIRARAAHCAIGDLIMGDLLELGSM
jgi:hypothetical protein